MKNLDLDAARAARDLGVAFWWLDPERKSVRTEGGWSGLFGPDAPTPPKTGDELSALVHTDDRHRFDAALASGEARSLTLRLMVGGGRLLPVLCRVSPGETGISGLWIEQANRSESDPDRVMHRNGDEAALRALAALPDGVSVYDPEDRLVLANARMIWMFGYQSPQDIVGSRFEDLVRQVLDRKGIPQAAGHEEAWLAELMRARAAGDLDYELEFDDGRIVRIQDRVLPDGWRVGTRVDVTDLRQRERAANDALTKMREAIESLPDAVFLLDEEGRFLLANEQVKRLFPLMADTIVPGNRFADMLRIGISRGAYPEAVGHEEEWIAEAMAFFTRAEPTVERTVRLSNGSWVLAIDRRLPAGGWISLRIDITAVKQNEARLAAILDGLGQATWEWDVADNDFAASDLTARTVDYWLASVGYSRADLDERPTGLFRRIAHPDDIARLDAEFRRHVAGEIDRIDVEVRQKHRDDGWVWGRVRGKISERDPEGRPLRVAGVLVDITDLKRVQLDLERSARLKLDFLERISHEIRTPLNGVLGAVSLLRAGGVTAEQEPLLEIAEQSGERLIEMIDRLVDLTRLEDGLVQLEPGPLSFDTLAGELRATHAPAAAARGIGFDILTDANADEPRRCDAVQLRRMLDRIIEHAIARTSTGGVEVRLRTIKDDGVRIEVADTGPALDKTDRDRVLEPLFHERGNARHEDDGDGLGLWAVKRLAEAMGGKLGVTEDLGGGLLVRLDLPLPVWTEDAA